MNRKQRIINLLKKKSKKPDKSLQNRKKEKYISKAERAKLALEAENTNQNEATNADSSEK